MDLFVGLLVGYAVGKVFPHLFADLFALGADVAYSIRSRFTEPSA